MKKPDSFVKKQLLAGFILLVLIQLAIAGTARGKSGLITSIIINQIDSVTALRIPIVNTWKFKAGDATGFIQTGFDASGWNNISTASGWEKQGHNTYGFSWYRNTVHISSQLKSLVTKEGILYLHLGKICDADITYFNGRFLGQTGNFPPLFKSAALKERAYQIKASTILWDQDNVIAIRVYADKPGNSGLYEGKCFLCPFVYTDFVKVKLENAHADWGLLSTVNYSNDSQKPVSGIFLYSVYNSSKQLVWQDTGHAKLVPGENHEFNFKAPLEANDIFYTTYTFIDDLRGIAESTDGYISNLSLIKLPIREPAALKIDFQQKSEFIYTRFEDQKLLGILGQRISKLLAENLLDIDDKKLLTAYFERNNSRAPDLLEASTLLDIGTSVWQYKNDAALKAQLDRLVYTIIQTQNKHGILYVATGSDENEWAKYNSAVYPATFSSILTYYQATGYKPALDCGSKFGNMVVHSIDSVINRQAGVGAISLKQSFSGFLIPLLDLYQLTGKEQYLNYGKLIAGLYSDSDYTLSYSKSANLSDTGARDAFVFRQLEDLTGLVRLSRITNDSRFSALAGSAWAGLKKNESFLKEIVLENSNASQPGLKASLHQYAIQIAWLRFNQQLFQSSREMRYYDEIEKQLYAPKPAANLVVAMAPEFLVGTVDQKPTFLSYEAGQYTEHINTANGTSMQVSIQCIGNYPKGDEVRLILLPERELSFTLMLRVPSWCSNFKAKIGTKYYSSNGNDFLSIQRLWKAGDEISIHYELPSAGLRLGQVEFN